MNTIPCSLPSKFYKELRISPKCSEDLFHAASAYIPRKGDIFIISYPKCGTTWTQHVVYLLHNKGIPSQDVAEVLNAIPFVEQDGFPDSGKVLALKYHLPFHLMPSSSDAKYIYVARNPKDTCVSYYHFLKPLSWYNITSFDYFFEAFLNGKVPYGDYMEHVMGWFDQSHHSNVLFFTYEDMINNHRDVVLRIAEFLDIEVNEETLSDVLKYSSFKFMKNHVDGDDYMVKYLQNGTLPRKDKADIREMQTVEHPVMIRRGIVGDWKNYFSREQSDRVNKRIAQHPMLLQLWKDVL